MRYKTVIQLLTLLGSITFIIAEHNDLYGEDDNVYPEYSPTVNFSSNYATSDFPTLQKKEKKFPVQNRPEAGVTTSSAMIPSSENPFKSNSYNNKTEENSNQSSDVAPSKNAAYYSEKNSDRNSVEPQNSDFRLTTTSKTQEKDEVLATIGSVKPRELFSTTVSGKGMFSVTGSNDEDPFDEGGGTDPNDGYNDVPIGDGNWYLVLLVLVYLFIKKRSSTNKEKLVELECKSDN